MFQFFPSLPLSLNRTKHWFFTKHHWVCFWVILFFKFRHLWAAGITTFWSLSGFILSSRIKMSYINGDQREQQNRNITLQLGLGLAAIILMIHCHLVNFFTWWTDPNCHKVGLPFRTTGLFFQHLTRRKHDNWCRDVIRQITKVLLSGTQPSEPKPGFWQHESTL